ncbi:hypothetical protein Ddc_07109 [Ditylenchus destructor]|nr:hypothetical protein Ddc_07109 [Ditylenchus destructor]
MVVFLIIVIAGAFLSAAGCCRRRQLNISTNTAKQPEKRCTETNTDTRERSSEMNRVQQPQTFDKSDRVLQEHGNSFERPVVADQWPNKTVHTDVVDLSKGTLEMIANNC